MKIYNLAFKYRIYPNETQANIINQTFGCTRLVYN
ncbi:helix-turn-helix domain-containing protein, partial [Cetobacterium ceti]